MPNVLSAKEVREAVAELTGGETTAAGVPPAFCKAWPSGKMIVELISKVSNTWVKLACAVVLKIGNALAKKCPA